MLMCRESASEKYNETLSNIQEADVRNPRSDSFAQDHSHGVSFDTAGARDHSLSTE
jgi:hypothetical protein